ncbi:MAG TPA: cation-transporting P-type ATPase [Gaiellaceae bacterium]|nr:cation-transporting P-type ATPase [Gaiellaceae bacterium]
METPVPGSIERLGAGEALEQLGSSPGGLGSEEARERLARYGANRLPELRRRSRLSRFLAQFKDFFAILLEVAGAITLAAYAIQGDPTNLKVAIAVFAVVLLNAVIGFVQEYRAERTAEALRSLLPARAHVLRDAVPSDVGADELVPGDVVLLAEGDAVSADCRLLEAFALATSDAALTGESDPVRRQSEPVLEEVPRIQARNLVFAGTSVASGTGRAVVYATGAETEFGHIYRLAGSVEDEPSPLQREVAGAARRVAVIAIGLGALLFVLRTVAGAPFVDAFLYALGVMVALVPEGLPAVMSVSLAIGVQRMAAEHALIKRLSSVETLGSTTVVCTDKTGTLTAGEMTAAAVSAGGRPYEVTGVGYEPEGVIAADGQGVPAVPPPPLALLLQAGLHCNNARLVEDEQHGWTVLGDPTEGALLVLARKGGLDVEAELRQAPRLHEIPFDSRRKRMAVVDRERDRSRVWAKGASTEILPRCTRIATAEGERELTGADRREVEREVDELAAQGLRVLALATRELPRDAPREADAVERELVFLGLVGLQDPPRPEVTAAVAQARSAGIAIVMITGDYGLTAEAIARKIGIVSEQHPEILTGAELETMDDAALRERLSRLEEQELLFARVAPADKLRVVAALKELDQVVAVTGDGVNDAPALRRADIGIAMGLAGTDVAKEASVMVLLDDSFATIVKAIEGGRAVYNNIRRFLIYLFTHNIGELFPIVFATLTGLPVVPLNALQVLSIDLGSDVLPALALGAEEPEPGLLEQPPRPRSERLMSRAVIGRFLFLGSIQAIGATASFYFALFAGGWHWGDPLSGSSHLYHQAITMTQAGIVFSQVFNGFAVRTDRRSVFAVGFFSNRRLVYAELLAVGIMLAISYAPPLQSLLGTAAIPASWWLVPAGFGVLALVAEELRKAFVRRRARLRGRM